jgi:hypothetical protein
MLEGAKNLNGLLCNRDNGKYLMRLLYLKKIEQNEVKQGIYIRRKQKFVL